MWMIFCGSTSGSTVTRAVDPSGLGVSATGAETAGVALSATGSAFFGGAVISNGVESASGTARIREMGGKKERFIFSSPSGLFGFGFSLSMSETVLARVRDAGFSGSGARVFGSSGGVVDLMGSAAEAREGLAADATLSLLLAGLLFGAARLRETVALRVVAGLRVAVLVAVRAGIVVPRKICSWLRAFNAKPFYCAVLT
jgi:hypothetical protein